MAPRSPRLFKEEALVAPSYSILRCFASLRDPRTSRRPKKHLLLDIVAIAICAVIAGADDWPKIEVFARARLDWLKTFLSLPNGVPSHDTFERIFEALSPRAFQRCFLLWVDELSKTILGKHFAIDGKTLRSSGREAKGFKALHLVSVWATQAKLTLGQVAVSEKSNEITAIPQLLDMLDLAGALVTIDAMGCQRDIATGVVAGGGDYLLVVKANQGRLYDDILRAFDDALGVDFRGVDHDAYQTHEYSHGRWERRHYRVLYDLDKIRDRDNWKGLKVIGMCCSERTVGDKKMEELRLFIGSRKETARFYGRHLRGHWGIENSCHWQLDVTFREDDNTVSRRNAAENLALIRRLALSLLKAHEGKESLATKRYRAALEVSFLEEILNSRNG
jgi:predicted transposase YbfD/YdcC